LQVAKWQGFPSLQFTGVKEQPDAGMQEELWQASGEVQVIGVYTHPVVGPTQASLVQKLLSLQTTGV